MDIKNIFKNIAPSVTIMVVGLVGAYFVYNTYFSDRVASGVAGYEPAAGEEMVVDEQGNPVAAEEGAVAMDSAGAVTTESAGSVTTESAGTMEEGAPASEGTDAGEDAGSDQ